MRRPFVLSLEEVYAEQSPASDDLARVKDIAVELVDMLVQELHGHRNILSLHKRAAQGDLNGQILGVLMTRRPPWVDADTASVLANKLMQQARANHEKLVQV